MASAWVHAVLCLIAFGRPYFDLNKDIDAWQEQLGPEHRMMGHDYYRAFGKLWSMEDPFPERVRDFVSKLAQRRGGEETEKEVVRLAHSYFDRVWNEFSEEERIRFQRDFASIALDPELLRRWAGVDMLQGKIHRSLEDGTETWDDAPDLVYEYQRLAAYIRAIR